MLDGYVGPFGRGTLPAGNTTLQTQLLPFDGVMQIPSPVDPRGGILPSSPTVSPGAVRQRQHNEGEKQRHKVSKPVLTPFPHLHWTGRQTRSPFNTSAAIYTTPHTGIVPHDERQLRVSRKVNDGTSRRRDSTCSGASTTRAVTQRPGKHGAVERGRRLVAGTAALPTPECGPRLW